MMAKRIQMCLSGEILEAFDIYCGLYYRDKEVKVRREYIISNLLDEFYPKMEEIDWCDIYYTQIANINRKRKRKSIQTTLTLKEKDIVRLSELQIRFAETVGLARVYKPFVIKMLLYAAIIMYEEVSVEKEERIKDKFQVDDIIPQLKFDSLVFKHEYENCTDPCKKELLIVVREYLENNPEVLDKLRKQINEWISGISDYYNISKYNPPRRNNFAKANITYITKCLAGFFITKTEIEGWNLKEVITEIRENFLKCDVPVPSYEDMEEMLYPNGKEE